MDDPPHAGGEGGRHDVGRAASVDLLEVVDSDRVDHAGGVHDVDRSRGSGEQRGEAVGPADVADHRLDAVDAGQGRRMVARRDQRPHRSGAAEPALRPGEVVEEGAAEPAGGAGHDGDIGRVEEGHDQLARLVVSTKRRALRMATAITEA